MTQMHRQLKKTVPINFVVYEAYTNYKTQENSFYNMFMLSVTVVKTLLLV